MQQMKKYVDTGLQRDLNELRTRPAISTKIKALDEILGGGLYAGMTILAAAPSAGKTALCISIMDTIAAAGVPTIYYSLETSAAELVARSCSREAAIYAGLRDARSCIEENKAIAECFSAASFLYSTGGQYRAEAELQYESIATNIYFDSKAKPVFGKDRDTIEADICTVERDTGARPAVVVDYLQLYAARLDSGKQEERAQLIALCSDLEKLSKAYHTQVLCVSSVNRAQGYGGEIEFNSLHGSNSIEYSADTVLALVYENESDIDQKGQPVRRLKIKQLKNRNSIQRGDALIDYIPRVNLFRDRISIK